MTSLALKNFTTTGHQWLTPVILATQEAEIKVGGQPGKIVRETLSYSTAKKKKKCGRVLT
jgi:7-cyano-7-deazaguanine synthase in queuosine biosynthesis